MCQEQKQKQEQTKNKEQTWNQQKKSLKEKISQKEDSTKKTGNNSLDLESNNLLFCCSTSVYSGAHKSRHGH